MGFLMAFAIISFLLIDSKYRRDKKMKKRIPQCPHCETDDTLEYNDRRDMFYCGFCERVIDHNYVEHNYKEDFTILVNEDKSYYDKFKKNRKGDKEHEKTRIANNESSSR